MPFILQDSNPGGGAALDTITTANSSGSTTLTWGSTVLIPTLTANITLNYPTPVGSIGAAITELQTGVPNGFTITRTPAVGSISLANSGQELSVPGGSLTIKAVDATTARQVSSIGNPPTGTPSYLLAKTSGAISANIATSDHAKFNVIEISSGTGITLDAVTAYTSVVNTASLGRFTLKAGGTYYLQGTLGDISYAVNVSGNYVSYGWFNADTGTALGTLTTIASDWNQTGAFDGSGGNAFALIAPVIDTRVELRIVGVNNINNYGGSLANSAAHASILQLSAATPVSGQQVADYVSTTRVAPVQALAANTDIVMNQLVAGNIPYNTTTGVYTLTAGKTYELLAALGLSFGGPTATVNYGWVDAGTNVSIQLLTQMRGDPVTSSNNFGAFNYNPQLYTPTTNQQIKLRVLSITSTCAVEANLSSVSIKQLGSSAVQVASTQTPVVQRFTAGGTYTPTPGMKWCEIEAIGGGGGGGSTVICPVNQCNAGTGGGSGGYIKVLATAAQIGASRSVIIGAGGAGNTAGGNTVMVGILNCAGGTAGQSGSVGSADVQTLIGTVVQGPLPALTLGTLIDQQGGNPGGISSSLWFSTPTAGTMGFFAEAGSGADSLFGSGGRARKIIAGGANTLALTAAGGIGATNSGAGGAGSAAKGFGSIVAGNNGAAGVMIVTEYF